MYIHTYIHTTYIHTYMYNHIILYALLYMHAGFEVWEPLELCIGEVSTGQGMEEPSNWTLPLLAPQVCVCVCVCVCVYSCFGLTTCESMRCKANAWFELHNNICYQPLPQRWRCEIRSSTQHSCTLIIIVVCDWPQLLICGTPHTELHVHASKLTWLYACTIPSQICLCEW